MAAYRCVSVGFWSDKKILFKFSPEDKFFFLYLLTNDRTNMCGCYELKIEDAAIDLGYTEETVFHLLERMENYHKVLKSRKTGEEHVEVLVLNWHKYNWNGSEKQLQAVRNNIDKIKTAEFAEYVLSKLESASAGVTKKKDEKPEPPTKEEVDSYAEEIGETEHARLFYFFYDSRNWRDARGKNIKDWRKLFLTFCEGRRAAGD